MATALEKLLNDITGAEMKVLVTATALGHAPDNAAGLSPAILETVHVAIAALKRDVTEQDYQAAIALREDARNALAAWKSARN
jgi:hypothetical protein